MIVKKFPRKFVYTKPLVGFFLLFSLCSPKPSYSYGDSDSAIVPKVDNVINNDIKDLKYILGPGDKIFVTIKNIEELSGVYTIGPDNNINIQELGEFKAGDMTLEEMKISLESELLSILKYPEVFVNIYSYRPVNVLVKGEVSRPGYYFVQSYQLADQNKGIVKSSSLATLGSSTLVNRPARNTYSPERIINFPTLYDAIRTAQGITPYSDLREVKVVRKNSLSNGGGYIQTKIDFLSVFTEGQMSRNIRLYDGDVVTISKSDTMIKDQLFVSQQTNLSPDFIRVYVTGNIMKPGQAIVPQGSGMTQAVAMAGGKRFMSGKVEFLRFNKYGKLDRRIIDFSQTAKLNTETNPILMNGDIINVRFSAIGATTAVIKTFATPILGFYSVYDLFDNE
tara:strand:+ start:577 stop:1758 length:1182 start_codon:yes stop_codon:yes gene_type:complete